eukprot:3727587-Rhodomonas_salina.1
MPARSLGEPACCDAVVMLFWRDGVALQLSRSQSAILNSDCATDTAILARAPAGADWGTMRMAVTAGLRLGSLTEALSFDPAISSAAVTNGMTTGGQTMSVSGLGLGHVDYSSRARGYHTACEASSWVADSAVVCRVAWGRRGSRGVSMTVGSQAATQTESWSVDAPWLSGVGVSGANLKPRQGMAVT